MMKITETMSEQAILQELGNRITQQRIDRRLTQAELATESGLSKRTVERMEAGAASQVSSLIRVLRVLDLLDGLHRLVPEDTPRPLDLLKLKGRERKRAPRRRGNSDTKKEWTWKDDR